MSKVAGRLSALAATLPPPVRRLAGSLKSGLKRLRSGSFAARAQLTHRAMVRRVQAIADWRDRIEFLSRYRYVPGGAWLDKSAAADAGRPANLATLDANAAAKVHYGCGSTIFPCWRNVDIEDRSDPHYTRVNLLEQHPFADNSVSFGFSEDMVEHLTQAESIFFLYEVHRSLAPGGVLRLSFPGLEGVLRKHYLPGSEEHSRRAEVEAYTVYDHFHFYSREELALVARHIGFTGVEFVEYGRSQHPELSNLDRREAQIGLNTYVELTK